MVKIALDATPLTEPCGGVSRYTAELTRALAECFPDDEFWLLSDQPFSNPALDHPNVKMGPAPRSSLERRWWLWGLQSQIARLGIQVFHGTDFAVPYIPARPTILTLHDLSPWRDPSWHVAADRVKNRTPVLLRLGLATLVLTPSEAIRREAMTRFGLAAGRVVSVPHAAAAHFHPAAPEPWSAPYLLYVGTLEPRKNLGMLLEVWREVRKRHAVDLILAGRRRSDFPEPPPEPGLHFLGEVPEERLPGLYSGCIACVYPSLYEGFGLPVLEAMQCGAAVVTSQDPAIVETAGGAALTVDAGQPTAWVEALLAVIGNRGLAGDLRERSLLRAAEFSWAGTARQTAEVYAEAARRFRRR